MRLDAEVLLDRIETLWSRQLRVLGLEFGDEGNHLGRDLVAAFGTPLARQQTGKPGRLQGILGLVKGCRETPNAVATSLMATPSTWWRRTIS